MSSTAISILRGYAVTTAERRCQKTTCQPVDPPPSSSSAPLTEGVRALRLSGLASGFICRLPRSKHRKSGSLSRCLSTLSIGPPTKYSRGGRSVRFTAVVVALHRAIEMQRDLTDTFGMRSPPKFATTMMKPLMKMVRPDEASEVASA